MDDVSKPNSEDTRQRFHDYQPGVAADVTFAHYPFLCVSHIPLMLPDDINYLDSQGCLRVPERRFMDELIKAYFRYVHPVLPVVDESDFGSAYYQLATGRTVTHVPVLLLQAMLFASCIVRLQGSSSSCVERIAYSNILPA